MAEKKKRQSRLQKENKRLRDELAKVEEQSLRRYDEGVRMRAEIQTLKYAFETISMRYWRDKE